MQIRKFGPETRQEYYEIAIPTGTVWVPGEGRASGLRKLTPKGDLGRYRDVLRGLSWPKTPSARQ